MTAVRTSGSTEAIDTMDRTSLMLQVAMTRRATLISPFPKEVLLYAESCVCRMIGGKLVTSTTVFEELARSVSEEVSQAFGLRYIVRFTDSEDGSEVLDLGERITMVIDSANALNTTVN